MLKTCCSSIEAIDTLHSMRLNNVTIGNIFSLFESSKEYVINKVPRGVCSNLLRRAFMGTFVGSVGQSCEQNKTTILTAIVP